MPITIDRNRRVYATSHLDLPLSASVVWGQMRDFPRFIAIDPLHTRIRIGKPPSAGMVGAPLIIPHRILGIGPDRIGRILSWREGRGYAFSDLSRRGRGAGFPHICAYHIRPLGPDRSRLTISARGLWTSPFMPRWAARVWIGWVLAATDARLIAYFAAFARWRSTGSPARPEQRVAL